MFTVETDSVVRHWIVTDFRENADGSWSFTLPPSPDYTYLKKDQLMKWRYVR